jgi:dienelactone hydrolase
LAVPPRIAPRVAFATFPFKDSDLRTFAATLAAAVLLATSLDASALTRFRIAVDATTELEHPAIDVTVRDASNQPVTVVGTAAFPSGRRVNAYVHVPDNGGPTYPVVLVNHGSSGPFNGNVSDLVADRLGEIYRLWAEYLVTRGYVAVVVDGFTTRGFIEDDRRIPNHTVGGTARTAAFYRAGPEVWSSANCGASFGSACVDNTTQRAYDVNHVADFLIGEAFTAELRARTGRTIAIDPARRFLMGHSDGGITTLAGMYHGHADGVGMPAAFGTASGYPRPRFAAAASFYPGCFMHGAFRDNDGDDEDGDGRNRDSVYYPSAPTLILHGDADELYRTDGLVADDCEWRLRSARVNASIAPFRAAGGFFEMVVYTGPGRVDSTQRGTRAGVQHSFDLANWDDTDDAEFTVPEHMAKVHADMLALRLFDVHASFRDESLNDGLLREGALWYAPTFLPSLPPVLQRRVDALGDIDRANVDLALPTLLQNPYLYDATDNPDTTGATQPTDFAVAYELVAPEGAAVPGTLAFDPATHRVRGALPDTANASFFVAAENRYGRTVQRFDVAGTGALALGPSYRIDTANGTAVAPEAPELVVDLDRYLGETPGRHAVAWCGATAGTTAVALTGSTLRVALGGATLPVRTSICLEIGGARFVEAMDVERHAPPGYPVTVRARFVGRYAELAAMQAPPAQDYADDSPYFGDGYGFDPADGDDRVAAPVDVELFKDGFE